VFPECAVMPQIVTLDTIHISVVPLLVSPVLVVVAP